MGANGNGLCSMGVAIAVAGTSSYSLLELVVSILAARVHVRIRCISTCTQARPEAGKRAHRRNLIQGSRPVCGQMMQPKLRKSSRNANVNLTSALCFSVRVEVWIP